jgi:hypothetical protein
VYALYEHYKFSKQEIGVLFIAGFGSVCLSLCLSVCLSVCLSICVSLCMGGMGWVSRCVCVVH